VEINQRAPATGEGEVHIPAPPEAVWAVMSDIESWPNWNPDIRVAKLEGPLAPGTVFRWKATTSLVSRLEVVDPPYEIAWTGTTMGIHAVHVYRFEADEGGTFARSSESWDGLIPKVLKGYSRRTLREDIRQSLQRLKQEVERRGAN
jgi:uncharacterized protein YndB with AHSA1/START domain